MDRQAQFVTFLEKSGAVVVPPTNEWELVRFRTANGVSVVYTNKKGVLTFTGESQKAYDAFRLNKGWKAVDRPRRALKALKSRLAARDGKQCFIHGEKLKFDQLTIEHLLSFGHGGSDNINNLCLACEPCNQAMGNMSVTQKMLFRDRKLAEYAEMQQAALMEDAPM